jgi:histidyl-tRNA synthetase
MYALRYDLTVPLARYVAMHPELPFPFKRQQIGPVWRHEEPQSGRYREFIQADIDTVGSPYIEADAEIVNAIIYALDKIGITDYQIRINHRKLLSYVFEKNLGITKPVKVYRAIDKLDKIGLEGVRIELEKTGLRKPMVDRILELIEERAGYQALDNIFESLQKTASVHELEKDIRFFIELIEKQDKILFDLSLVRGLDYYTGVIFEVVTGKTRGSIAGGGRYDELIGLFRRGESIPATGGSIGFERVMNIIHGEKELEKKTVTSAIIINLDKKLWRQAWKIAEELRRKGVPVETDIMRRSQAKQKKRAQALGIRYMIFVGQKEMEKGVFTVYDRILGERKELSMDDIVSLIQK